MRKVWIGRLLLELRDISGFSWLEEVIGGGKEGGVGGGKIGMEENG